MSAGAPTNARWEGGRLVLDPANKALPYPYGGTELGLVRELYLEPTARPLFIRAEEFGGSVVEVATGEIEVVCGFVMRGWDRDLVGSLPGGTNAGSGLVVYTTELQGALRPGVRLLFVPDNRTSGVYYYLPSAVVMPRASAQAQASFNREFGLPLIVWGTTAPDGRYLEWGTFAQITL